MAAVAKGSPSPPAPLPVGEGRAGGEGEVSFVRMGFFFIAPGLRISEEQPRECEAVRRWLFGGAAFSRLFSGRLFDTRTASGHAKSWCAGAGGGPAVNLRDV